MKRLVLFAAVLLAVLAHPGAASTPPARGSVATGADISWPNCPQGRGIPARPSLGLPMPLPRTQFVVIGLTSGPAFTTNPCLASQVAWVKTRHIWAAAYAVASYPNAAALNAYAGRGPAVTRLHRTGVAQAQRNVRAMRRAGLASPMMWVDVEPGKSLPWSRNPTANNAVIDGAVAGYHGAGLKVGFYSYANGWRQITGGRRLPAYATWVPSGDDQRSSALRRCSQRSFSDGRVLLAQWAVANRDRDVTCPGVTGLVSAPPDRRGALRSRMPSLFAST